MNIITQYKGLRKEIYVLFFGRIVTSLGSMIWPMLTLILSQKLGMTATQVALLNIISGVILLPASLAGGKLADHYDRKKLIVVCDFISVSLYILCAFIPLSLFTIAVLVVASGCQTVEHPSYTALIADLTLTKDRERAYSLSYLGMNLGLVASPTIAGLLFENHLWVSFLASGLSILMSTLLILFLIKDTTPVVDTNPAGIYQAKQEDVSLVQILKKNRILLLYALITTLYWGAYGQYGYLMPMDMGKIHGDQGAVIYGTVNSLNCIVVVLFTPLLTRVFARMVSTRKCTLGNLLLIAGYIVFITNRGRIPAYYIAMFLFTLGEIMATFVEGPYLSQRIPVSHRGRVTSVMGIAQGVLQGGTTLLTGILYDRAGPTSAWALVIGMLLVSVTLSVFLNIFDRRCYPALYIKGGSSSDQGNKEEALQSSPETAGHE